MFRSDRHKKEVRTAFRVILSTIWTVVLLFILVLYPPDSLVVWIGIALCWLAMEIMIFTTGIS